ncbi:MAG: 4-hydroxy-tetrahydrodipicolinate reductase [Chitinophagaceae bacterium]|nr:4-hydroxy-tetrahydrodipicolinate reductase [Chitinophagaceae bacterium]
MKIALIGYGKMGKAIEEIALKKGHEVVLKISSFNTYILTSENIRSADVAIEFSKPETAYHNILFCLENGTPVVCGTTGWLKHLHQVTEKCKEVGGSFLYASNFSVGVNVFFEINDRLAQLMKDMSDYDVKIEETHHIHKKDAPSGTAITLAEGIITTGKKEKYALTENAASDELTITSIRRDEVPGTHVIEYTSENDRIVITHEAFNRKGFAAGAVLAAEYIHDKHGIFTMKDVLHIG